MGSEKYSDGAWCAVAFFVDNENGAIRPHDHFPDNDTCNLDTRGGLI